MGSLFLDHRCCSGKHGQQIACRLHLRTARMIRDGTKKCRAGAGAGAGARCVERTDAAEDSVRAYFVCRPASFDSRAPVPIGRFAPRPISGPSSS